MVAHSMAGIAAIVVGLPFWYPLGNAFFCAVHLGFWTLHYRNGDI
jgi:hypothetical protein